MSFNKTFKVILTGTDESEKDRLIKKTANFMFSIDSFNPIGVEYFIKDIQIEAFGTIRLQIWSILEDDKFNFLIPTYINGASSGIILIDITDPDSLGKFNGCLELLRGSDPLLPVLLLGTETKSNPNCADLYDEANHLVESKCCNCYIEVSTETGENIELMFRTVALLSLEHANT